MGTLQAIGWRLWHGQWKLAGEITRAAALVVWLRVALLWVNAWGWVKLGALAVGIMAKYWAVRLALPVWVRVYRAWLWFCLH